MKLDIVRHGETVWNRHHKVQGVADIPLAENGILLAEKTGEALKNVSFDLCITSPLVRARKTAELILAKQAHKVPVKAGTVHNDTYIIESGLSAGDVVITNNLTKLRPGSAVIVAEAKE